MKACLFDLDGTITDTDVIWIDALADTLAALGHPVPTSWTMEIVYGKAWSSSYARIVERFPDLASIPSDELAHKSDAFFRARVAATDDLNPHANVQSSLTVNDADEPEPQSIRTLAVPVRFHATFVQLAALFVYADAYSAPATDRLIFVPSM